MKGKIQERMERGSRKRSSSAGSEKMERVGDRQGKMEGYCSTGQSPQWAECQWKKEEKKKKKKKKKKKEEEEEEKKKKKKKKKKLFSDPQKNTYTAWAERKSAEC